MKSCARKNYDWIEKHVTVQRFLTVYFSVLSLYCSAGQAFKSIGHLCSNLWTLDLYISKTKTENDLTKCHPLLIESLRIEFTLCDGLERLSPKHNLVSNLLWPVSRVGLRSRWSFMSRYRSHLDWFQRLWIDHDRVIEETYFPVHVFSSLEFS